MDPYLYTIIAILYCVLFIYGLKIGSKEQYAGLRYLLILITLSLIWDNGIVAAGKMIGEGALLEALNLSRYWLHALFTPLLALISYDIARQAGSPLARHSSALWITTIFTLALIGLELLTETIGVKLTPSLEYGALRYTTPESSGPPIMVLLILIPLFIAGIIVWRRKKWPWLFLGTLIMTIGSAVPISIESTAAVNIFEWILILSLWLTIGKLSHSRASH